MCLLLVAGAFQAHAQQLLTGKVTEGNEMFKLLTGDTPGKRGDDAADTIPMPFTFRYDDQTVNTMYVYTNGFISLNTPRNPSSAAIPKIGQYPNIISWYSADLFVEGRMSYKVEGNAPFRVFTVQVTDARTVTDFSGSTFDIQIKFYETTNEIKFIWGDVSGVGNQALGYFYMTGNPSSEYINIQPQPQHTPSNIYYSDVNPNTAPGLTDKADEYLFPGKTYYYRTLPNITRVNPPTNTILNIGEVYAGTEERPYVLITRAANQQNIAIEYRIIGPVDSAVKRTIYQGIQDEATPLDTTLDFTTQPVGINVRYDIPHAKGIIGRGSDGALDLLTNQSQIIPGEYILEAKVIFPGFPSLTQTSQSRIFIAFANDLMITRMTDPVASNISIYNLSQNVPLAFDVRNIGRNPIRRFTARADIYNATNGSLVRSISQEVNYTGNPLVRGETRNIVMSEKFQPTSVGNYRLVYTVTLIDPTVDGNPSNNVLPRASDPTFTFGVGYETELAVTSADNLTGNIYLYRPFRPQVTITNNGVVDIPNVPLAITIRDQDGNIVYTQTATIPSVPSGTIKTLRYTFDEVFTPLTGGVYTVLVQINPTGDEIPSNNTLSQSFTVIGGLSGEYTISANPPSGTTNNFFTIQEAVDAMYLRGIAGPVTFTLNDASYSVGNPMLTGEPALDITSFIAGLSDVNTVTFRASDDLMARGSVKIRLLSGNGVGILFGQNSTPTNPYAPVRGIGRYAIARYSRPAGHIIFDGGPLRSIEFILETNAGFRSAFYLSQGASNITLKNLIIRDAAPLYAGKIPLTRFNASASVNYEFEPDAGLTSGVLFRSLPPRDKAANMNIYNLDVLVNQNNLITSNEISGFAYGVVSLGIGGLPNDTTSLFQNYYNNHNTFSNNVITGVSHSAFFFGFEDSSVVLRNRIYGINGGFSPAYGISAGNEGASGWFGYNNTRLRIDGNEITDLTSRVRIAAIRVIQDKNVASFGGNQFVFPNIDESFVIVNNTIWNLNAIDAAANVYGIQLMTARPIGSIGAWATAPDTKSYFTKNDLIANNTIILDDRGEEDIVNTGEYFNIAVGQTRGLRVFNNALAIKDNQIAATNSNAAFLGVYTTLNGGLFSDRNAFWAGSSDVDIARWIRSDSLSVTIEPGFDREFKELAQWQGMTLNDLNSIANLDFTQNLVTTTDVPARLRVRTTPLVSGSALVNRGERLPEVLTDIDGEPRGIANQRYDLGADEFIADQFISDLEMLNFATPIRYKAGSGKFSDAEYVMTTAPVEVKVRLRNNGSIRQNGVDVRLRIIREGLDGTFENGTVVIDETTQANNLASGESLELNYRLGDNAGKEFIPQTYSEFIGANAYTNIPAHLRSMTMNVTPRYKLEVVSAIDQNNANNRLEKVVRFFIKRSNLHMLLSGESLIANFTVGAPPADPNILAANLNMDSLKSGLRRLGWFNRIDLENPRYDYDIFDRKGWEPRSTDYTIYRTLFYADGLSQATDDQGQPVTNNLSVVDRRNFENFFNNVASGDKKNFFAASEELVRLNEPLEPYFTNYFLRASAQPNPYAIAPGANYAGHNVVGVNIARNFKFLIKESDFEAANKATYPDNYPQPGRYTITAVSNGTARVGFVYDTVSFTTPPYDSVAQIPQSQKVAGIAMSTIKYNNVLVGVDWRHFNDVELLLRTGLDFMENNGGSVIPIELVDFTANKAGRRVDLRWTTATEIGASRFEIERATETAAGANAFFKIDEVRAVGNSNDVNHYGPIVDRDVKAGNVYTYRLKMLDANGEFKYSPERRVNFGDESVISIEQPNPNPVSSISTVNYSLSGDAYATLSVFDAQGSLVTVLAEGALGAGEHTARIDASRLASGYYTIVLRQGEQVLTMKMNVIK